MKTQNLFILFSVLLTNHLYSQDCSEYQKHLQSIDSTYYPGHFTDKQGKEMNANRAFVDYTIKNLLENPADKCFISNRKLLKKLNKKSCDSTSLYIHDTLMNGENCKINITLGNFEEVKHHILSNEDSTAIENIDGQFPYGGQYGIPRREIRNIYIEVGGSALKIPIEAYSNFYNPYLCENRMLSWSINAFESINGDYIYLYIMGGNAAGTYFAKLIFDKTKYLSRIVSDYYPLSIHGSFREGFIGF